MKLFIYSIFTILVLTIAFASQSKNTTKSEATDLTEDDVIREIVFKKLLESYCLKTNKLVKAFLSVDDGKDPSENLFKKLSDSKTLIRKVSDAPISLEKGTIELNSASTEQGVLVFISKLEWKNNNEIKVNAGHWTGNLGGNGCDYILKKKDNEWKFITTENCYVS